MSSASSRLISPSPSVSKFSTRYALKSSAKVSRCAPSSSAWFTVISTCSAKLRIKKEAERGVAEGFAATATDTVTVPPLPSSGETVSQSAAPHSIVHFRVDSKVKFCADSSQSKASTCSLTVIFAAGVSFLSSLHEASANASKENTAR